MNDLISKKALLEEIEAQYDLSYGAIMINPRDFYDMVDCQKAVQQANKWIPVSERLPQLPDGKSFMPLNVTILAPSGLRNTVPMTWELKRGKPTWCYLGEASDWNVIAWQPLPEPYTE